MLNPIFQKNVQTESASAGDGVRAHGWKSESGNWSKRESERDWRVFGCKKRAAEKWAKNNKRHIKATRKRIAKQRNQHHQAPTDSCSARVTGAMALEQNKWQKNDVNISRSEHKNPYPPSFVHMHTDHSEYEAMANGCVFVCISFGCAEQIG